MLYLVVIELTKVLHVHLTLICISHSSKAAQLYVFHLQATDSSDNIAELTHAGGLDEDAIRCIGFHYLSQSLGKVTHQAAADATAVHFSDLYAGFFQKATVDANLAELVFDQHQLFALIGFFHQFLNQGGFTGTQKTGENINLGHVYHSFSAYGSDVQKEYLSTIYYITLVKIYREELRIFPLLCAGDS